MLRGIYERVGDVVRCPFCGFEDTKVIDSRSIDLKKRRRRECGDCGKRFTTYETMEKPLLMVLKKDGNYEPFDRDKLVKGIYNAIKKRPVSASTVDSIVDEIESYYYTNSDIILTSLAIGDSILSKLKDVDLVAYVRFASVYKDFTDVQSFVKIISELQNKTGQI